MKFACLCQIFEIRLILSQNLQIRHVRPKCKKNCVLRPKVFFLCQPDKRGTLKSSNKAHKVASLSMMDSRDNKIYPSPVLCKIPKSAGAHQLHEEGP